MRQGNRKNTKEVARTKYAERQINKFIKWSITQKGYLRWKDLVEYQDYYNIKVETK